MYTLLLSTDTRAFMIYPLSLHDALPISDPFVLPKSTWDYIVQFWYLDLSQTDSIMPKCYSVFGPEPRLPSCMMRSYLLALKLKVTSITDCCRMLREAPLYALLSGFPSGDTPGVRPSYAF